MERRDYLITQIQELGRFLRLLTEKLTGKALEPSEEVHAEQQKSEFKEKSGFEIDLLATPHFEELQSAIMANNGFNTENTELLADFMVQYAETQPNMLISMQVRIKTNALFCTNG
ncbi:MAG: hypothetical protein HC905_13870 [Bacteroidales bacterium]|nr:hypothetical protein [Bacteroidales bacterium]